MKKLFEINPEIDRAASSGRFSTHGRVQVRNVLTRETAEEIRTIMQRGTPWSMAVLAGESQTKPKTFRHYDIATPAGTEEVNRAAMAAHQASARRDYAFRYGHYPIVDALNERWDPDGPYEILLEHLNAPEFLQLARDVTGIGELVKADGQATLFAPNHYLGRHSDSHVAEGWRVAYVMNFTTDDWHPDWGGYLMFLNEDGDVVEGFRPRFNSLNLFAVPQTHLVTYVPPFAPVGRFALTGWLRDR